MRAPVWWVRIGGDSALTRWSWIIALPFGVALALSSSGPVPHLAAWLGVVLAAHLGAAAVLGTAHATVLRPGDRPSRTVTALVTFAAAGATRAVGLSWGYPVTGASDPVSTAARVSGNVILAVVLLSLIAVTVDSSRQHYRLMAELLVAQRTLDALSDAREEELHRIDRQVDGHLALVLSPAGRDQPADRSAWLRTSAETVRRASHDLDREALAAIPLPAVPAPRRRDRLTPLLARLRPAPPLTCAAIIELAPIAGVATQCGWQVAVFNAVVGGSVLVILGEALRRGYRVVARGTVNLLLLAAGYALVALAALVVTRTLGLLVGVQVPYFTLAVPFVVTVALGLSLVGAVRVGYAADLRLREEAVAAAAERADTFSREVQERRRSLAALLHGPVQSEFLRAAVATRDDGDVGERIRSLLAAPRAEVPARQEVLGVAGAWRSTLDLAVTAPEELWPVLDAQPAARRAVIDVISEGLANVIRHGSGSQAGLRLTLDRDAVTVELTSRGTLSTEREPGLGSTILARLCSTWEVDGDATSVRLFARIPSPHGAGAVASAGPGPREPTSRAPSADTGQLLAQGEVHDAGPPDPGTGHDDPGMVGDHLADDRRTGGVGTHHRQRTVGVLGPHEGEQPPLVGDQ